MNGNLGFVDVSLAGIGTALLTVAALLGAAAWLLSQWRTGSAKAGQSAVANWKEMALSEEARRKRLEVEIAKMELDLEECAKYRDEFATHVVRAVAREKQYRECIDGLEAALGRDKTEWEPLPDVRPTPHPNR